MDGKDTLENSVVGCAPINVFIELLDTGSSFGGKVDMALIKTITSKMEDKIKNVSHVTIHFLLAGGKFRREYISEEREIMCKLFRSKLLGLVGSSPSQVGVTFMTFKESVIRWFMTGSHDTE